MSDNPSYRQHVRALHVEVNKHRRHRGIEQDDDCRECANPDLIVMTKQENERQALEWIKRVEEGVFQRGYEKGYLAGIAALAEEQKDLIVTDVQSLAETLYAIELERYGDEEDGAVLTDCGWFSLEGAKAEARAIAEALRKNG